MNQVALHDKPSRSEAHIHLSWLVIILCDQEHLPEEYDYI